eukprot:80136-Chlamydomonas_euryale.AAC.2
MGRRGRARPALPRAPFAAAPWRGPHTHGVHTQTGVDCPPPFVDWTNEALFACACTRFEEHLVPCDVVTMAEATQSKPTS